MEGLKIKYRAIRKSIRMFCKIDWYQTLKINGKNFDLRDAIKLPLVIFRGYKVRDFNGAILFNVPLEFGLVGFGQPYEIFSRTEHTGEAVLSGTIEINGRVQFGIDTKLFVAKNAKVSFGNINSFATKTQIICYNKISFGNYVQCGGECVFVDTNFHDLIDVEKNEKINRVGAITIGNYNYIGIRTLVRSHTITPNHCLIASNSLCNKDYRSHGEKILLAGLPINKVKYNIMRDWEGEMKELMYYLTITFK